MRAIVIDQPGGPEVLQLRDIPKPSPEQGQVLIRIRAFGLNRAEWFTRRGDSPSVEFPRVIGIECVGEVVSAPGTELQPGQRVAAMMGGMGREYDGSYAEYTCVPQQHVFALDTELDWPVLGALPEMFQTVNGSLTAGLDVQSGHSLLIRGGTSSIGLTTAILAKRKGATVYSTTRSQAKADKLTAVGVDHVIVDTGTIAPSVRELSSGGVDRVLELVGTTTLGDSLAATRPGGVVCMTGILGGQWVWPDFEPMQHIPTGVRLTSYSGGSGDIERAELQAFIDLVANGDIDVPRGPVFKLEDIQRAHELMDQNRAGGKLVVVVD